MSQPGKKGKGSKKGAAASAAAAAAAAAKDDKTDDSATLKGTDDAKDDSSSNSDKKETKPEVELPVPPPKPQSAGATARDGSQKLLNLAMKGEWIPVENSIKQLEKAVAAGGEDASTTPLAGVMDPVSFSCNTQNFRYFHHFIHMYFQGNPATTNNNYRVFRFNFYSFFFSLQTATVC